MLLESGRAHVRVTHRPAAKWVVDAGPYSVHVVGTEFDVRWSGSEEVLDVHLHHGAVIVRGPLASGGLAMEAGQRLVANVKEGEIFLDASPARPGESAAELLAEPGEAPQPVQPSKIEPPAAAPAPAHHTSRSRAGALHVAPAATVDEASWSKLIAQGDFRGVLSDAERRGLERTLTAGSAADLTALADAARYLRRGELARRAYLAERERFPRSAGREAAFFLGGLSEDESGVTARKAALEWYERYLAESPHGTYVPAGARPADGAGAQAARRRRGAAAGVGIPGAFPRRPVRDVRAQADRSRVAPGVQCPRPRRAADIDIRGSPRARDALRSPAVAGGGRCPALGAGARRRALPRRAAPPPGHRRGHDRRAGARARRAGCGRLRGQHPGPGPRRRCPHGARDLGPGAGARRHVRDRARRNPPPRFGSATASPASR